MRAALFWVIMQRNNPEERSSLLLGGGSLKSDINILVTLIFVRKRCRVSVKILFPTPRSAVLFLGLTYQRLLSSNHKIRKLLFGLTDMNEAFARP